MKGLLLKDFYMLKSMFKFYAFLVVVWGAVAVMNKNGSYFSGLMAILIYLIPVSALTSEDKMKTTSYILTMPFSRKDLVKEKYLIGVIVAGIGFAISFIVNIFFSNVVVGLTSSFFIISLGIMFLAISMPFIYKFGFEKARIICMILIIVPCCIVPIAVPTVVKKGADIDSAEMLLFGIVLLAVSILFMFISLMISVKIMSKKEF